MKKIVVNDTEVELVARSDEYFVRYDVVVNGKQLGEIERDKDSRWWFDRPAAAVRPAGHSHVVNEWRKRDYAIEALLRFA